MSTQNIFSNVYSSIFQRVEIAKRKKQPKCPGMNEEQIEIYQYSDIFSIIKRNKVLTHVTMWVKLNMLFSVIEAKDKGHILYDSFYILYP